MLKAPSQNPYLGCMILNAVFIDQAQPLATSNTRGEILNPNNSLDQYSLRCADMFVGVPALLFCLYSANDDLHEHLLRRTPGDWFPHIPFNPEYYRELSGGGLLRDMNRRELKTQMILLLLELLEFLTGRTSSLPKIGPNRSDANLAR